VTVHATTVLGRVEDPRFAGRRIVAVPVAWDEASRRRLRRAAADGTDVAIELSSGGYLADGAVLDDDGERVVVVVRPPEPALVIELDLGAPAATLVEQALLIGHAFGNQHVPVELGGNEVRVPLTTSEAVAVGTVDALELEGILVAVRDVALGLRRPLTIGHGHGHPRDDR
jgi:urease accessory protein